MSNPRVRFAPSPTGFVHIGSLRTALYNYLFAKNKSGTFILRIEDTDRNRHVEGATENFIRILEWAGIIPDEGPEYGGSCGPYFQSQRLDVYRKYCHELVENELAYYAFDTPEELESMRVQLRKEGKPFSRYNVHVRQKMRNSLTLSGGEVQREIKAGTPYVIRLLVPEDRLFQFNDIIREKVTFKSQDVDDQVLMKSDGYPTYHLANVVDDYLMGITHIIRGEEWLSSVPKHLLLYEYFKWQPPAMAHLPLIFNPDGTKMSKRDIRTPDNTPAGKVDPDMEAYVRSGYEKDAVINYLALLGWNPGEGDERQIFSLAELIKEFSLERVNKSPAIFDIKKLNWINGEHLSQRDTRELVEQIKKLFEKNDLQFVSDDYLLKVVDLLKSRVHFMGDFIHYGKYFFSDPDDFDQATVKKRWKSDSAKLAFEFSDEISKLKEFTPGEIESALRRLAEKHQVNAGKIIHPVRIAVTGTGVGPGLFEILELLGRETVIRRLKQGAEKISRLET